MADEIKQKIVLEGEKEYSAALKEANRNLKTLRSALKAETAELGANASAQQKNETKTRSLKKQIEQQEKIVNTLKTALKEVKDKYGDNSDEVAKWEQKLNAARYTLADMNNKLQTAEQSLKAEQDALKDSTSAYDDAANAANDYANAVDSAGATADGITFQSVMTAADNLTNKLKSAIHFIIEVGKSAWEWMGDSGKWADELSTDATKWGIDRQTLQGWRYASRFVDTEVETIARAFTKLTNRSDSTNKKLKEIGLVADSGVKGQDLFWQVVESLSAMDDEAKRDAAAMDIFGKSYQELLPLINAGREAWEGYVKEAEESGYVLSDDQVDKLGAFDDANQKLNASFEAMQHTIAAELAPAFTEVSTAMSGLIDSFTEWAKTEQGQKTLGDLGNALKELVQSFTGDQNFTGLVEGAAAAVKGLTDALGWIKDNKELVVGGIGGIGAALAALTISKDVLSALMLIKGIKWFGGGGGGATAGGSGGGIFGTIGSLLGKGASALQSIDPTGILALLPTVLGDKTAAGRTIRDGGGISDAFEAGKAEVSAFFDSVKENASTFAEDWGKVFQNIFGFDATTGEAQAALGFQFSPEQIAAAQEYWDAYRNGEDGGDALENLVNAIPDSNVLDSLLNKMENFMMVNDGMAEDIPTGWFSDVLDSMTWEDTGLTSEDVSGFQSLPGDIEAAVASGIASGTSGMSISMDGAAVGWVVTPYVSQAIASQMIM